MDVLSIDRKTWRKIPLIEQGYLCKNYEIILLDYWVNPVKQNLDKITPLITIKNTQKGIGYVSDGIEKFSKMMDEFKIFPGKADPSKLMGSQKKNLKI